LNGAPGAVAEGTPSSRRRDDVPMHGAEEWMAVAPLQGTV
jgi:hypothetical protein